MAARKLLQSAALLAILQDAVCNAQVVALPIQNVSLSNSFVSRGVSLTIGTPSQQLAFTPAWPQNNVYVYNSGVCNDNDDLCDTESGGLYTSSASVSSRPASAANPSDADPAPGFVQWTHDLVTLASGAVLGGFPLGQLGQSVDDDLPKNALGLGKYSTLLTTLKNAGHIASLSWSMFFGQDSPTAQMDGSLVLGGYDESMTLGTGISSTFSSSSDGCPSNMMVQVSGMSLNFQDGNNVPIFDESKAYNACIMPSLPTVMTLPNGTFDALNNIWGNPSYNAVGESSDGPYYGTILAHNSNGAPYPVDLTVNITINGATMPIRIANSQLFTPVVTYAADGDLNVDTTQHLARLYPTTEQPMLGSVFLSAAYLFANLDTETFTLWQANTASSTPSYLSVNASGSAATDPSPAVPSSEAAPPSHKKGLPPGSTAAIAVAGAIVGGILLFGALSVWSNRNGSQPWLAEDPTSLRARLGRFRRFMLCGGGRDARRLQRSRSGETAVGSETTVGSEKADKDVVVITAEEV